MFSQVTDFKAECDALHKLLAPLDDSAFQQNTLFKDWTINHILGHLHMWNWAADLSASAPDAFQDFKAEVIEPVKTGKLRKFEQNWRGTLGGTALLDAWRQGYQSMCASFATVEPKARLAWAGPDMSARSSVTARLMETWAHSQAIYDLMGIDRADTDRIKNIVVLGINTFGWTYSNRGLDVPAPAPYVALTAPSGELWEFNKPETGETPDDIILGSATGFCQVVTQCRNVADTNLLVTGDTANQWMSFAQCFAGPPEQPPPVGFRSSRPST